MGDTQIEELDLKKVKSDFPLLCLKGQGSNSLSKFCESRLNISEQQLTEILETTFLDIFSDTLPREYLTLIGITTVNSDISGRNDGVDGLAVEINIVSKEDLLCFADEYALRKGSVSIQSFWDLLDENLRFAELSSVNNDLGEIFKKRFERGSEGITIFGCYDFQIYPYCMDSPACVRTTEIKIVKSNGKYPPLRFKERVEHNLPSVDYALRFQLFMKSVVKSLLPNRNIFYSANVVTEDGKKFFTRKAGYLVRDDFLEEHKYLLRECPITMRDTSGWYCYLFE